MNYALWEVLNCPFAFSLQIQTSSEKTAFKAVSFLYCTASKRPSFTIGQKDAKTI